MPTERQIIDHYLKIAKQNQKRRAAMRIQDAYRFTGGIIPEAEASLMLSAVRKIGNTLPERGTVHILRVEYVLDCLRKVRNDFEPFPAQVDALISALDEALRNG